MTWTATAAASSSAWPGPARAHCSPSTAGRQLDRPGCRARRAAAPQRRPAIHLRPDQRQPYRLQQAAQRGCARHIPRGDRQGKGAAGAPDFIIHTGDVSQLSRDQEFDDADQMLKDRACRRSSCPASTTCSIPTAARRTSIGSARAATATAGTVSITAACISSALVNVADLKPGGMGNSAPSSSNGSRDLAGALINADRRFRPYSAVDGLRRLGLGHGRFGGGAEAARPLRFGDRPQRPYPPVTQKVEGRIAFHTARSTAFPQPAPGPRLRRARSRFRPSSFTACSGLPMFCARAATTGSR